MEEIYTLLILAFVGILIVLFCYIDKLEQDKKQKELDEAYKEYEKEQQARENQRRQEESVEWNKYIQSKFNNYIKYKTNKPIKALVGDYSKSMASLTNSILRSMGIKTEVVPTASDIIDKISAGNKYDIIITNNVYPNGESGQMVLNTLKENVNFNIPIVILTVDQNARSEYKSIGFDEYIEKPLNESKVKEILPKVIKGLEFTEIKKQ